MANKYRILNAEFFGYNPIEVENPEFQFSLEWVDEEIIQSHIDNWYIELI